MMVDAKQRIKALREVLEKIESSLQGSIDVHVDSSEFGPSQGLDFLDCKNTVLLSYLIDLTFWLRCQLADEPVPAECLHRLIEMRTILDKIRVLDKKLRYQIDKLLTSSQQDNEALAQGGDDPLLYRPRVVADDDDDDDDDGSSSDGSTESDHRASDSEDEDLDGDLASARLTLALAKERKLQKKGEQQQEGDGIYHAPRHAAVPYTLETSKEARRQNRRLLQLQASEVAESIRHQYSETPEQEDSHGAALIGKQRASSRRMAAQEAQRTSFEEDNMIRLTVSRKEKKDRKKMLREETSNLHAISDLGNLVNEASLSRGSGKKSRDYVPSESARKTSSKKSRISSGPKNSLTAALQGKEKKKRRR